MKSVTDCVKSVPRFQPGEATSTGTDWRAAPRATRSNPRKLSEALLARVLRSARRMLRWTIGGLVAAISMGCGASTSQKNDDGAGGVAGAGGGDGGLAASGGAGGSGGEADTCCMADFDCPKQPGDGTPEVACVDGVCKERPGSSRLTCWIDDDCAFGDCNGVSVCGCDASCPEADRLGSCPAPPEGCCIYDDAACTSPDAPQCAGGKCVPLPPAGKCFNQSNCASDEACSGSYECLLGTSCGPKSNGCESRLGDCTPVD